MQVKSRKFRILLLFIFLVFYQCKPDKKQEQDKNLDKIEKKLVANYKSIQSPKEIDSLISNGFPYTKKEFDLNDYSSEGGSLESYSNKKGSLIKLKATYFGHSGKSQWNYYFKNDSLFFVDKQEYRYKSHISNKQDVVIDSIIKSEYYLERGNLIKWIDETKSVVNEKSEKFKKEDNYLKQDVNEFRQIINGNSSND
jgi:hypothetical protein